MFLNPETYLSIFNCYVASVLNYASAIIGTHGGLNLERVHLEFCKRLLGVNKSTSNVMMYTELARFPLRVNRIVSMIKYWYKLLKTDNCILQCCYNQMYKHIELKQQVNWAYGVKTELCKLGYGDVCVNQEMGKNVLPVIRQRLYYQALQGIVEICYSSSKCNIYIHTS
jgi:hypothetical protein